VINPAGGGGRTQATWQLVEPTLRAEAEVEVRQTERPGHGTELAKSFVADGFEIVVAIGGDGTINEVGNGLVRTPATFAIIPSGTANDLVRTLGLPSDPKAAARVILAGQTIEIDVGEAVGHRYFFNIAGLGFDAEVIRSMEAQSARTKSLGPTLRYWMAILRTFAKFPGVDVTLEIDGQISDRKRLLLLAVGPAQFYGNGMRMLPDASLTDGLIDFAGGANLSWLELIRLMKKIYRGEHLSHPKTFSGQATEIVVRGPETSRFHLDGDLAGSLPVTFRSIPGGIKIKVPQRN